MVEEEKEGEETKEIIQTPSPELETLRLELESIRTELDHTKKGLSTAHQTLTEKDKELKKRANLESQIASIQNTVEDLATVLAAKGGIENLDSDERQEVLAKIQKRRDEQEAKRKQEEAQSSQLEYARQADSLYNRAKVVFADDDDALERVEELLMNGRAERAEVRIAKAEQKKAIPKKENMETEEQRIERLAQEKLNKLLEERGLLEEHSASPSASGSASEAMQKYISGEITVDEAAKRGARF